jgi:site-specific recombinase XerD
MCEEFLSDAERHLAYKTYKSYLYSCQMFVDDFGTRAAHTMKPADIRRFSLALQKHLGPTTQAIVLRSVQRAFNWAVEEQIIPPHSLGRIRKPRGNQCDRFVTDEEFQSPLRTQPPQRASPRRGVSPAAVGNGLDALPSGRAQSIEVE